MRQEPREPTLLEGILTRGQPAPRSIRTIQEGLGSGVIIDASGLILTNAHVIAGADAIHYRTADGDDGDVTVIGTDADSDLALLRAQTSIPLRPAPLGNSARVNVGDWVVAIGSPLGLHHTVTAGIVSAKARGLDDSGLEFLQTDAAINPGNSGGALFDLKGALIGITTAIVSAGGENIGLNFAIPIDTVKEVLPQLRMGNVVHGWIGIRMVDVSRSGARAMGINSGLIVVGLADGGPAALAGIRVGDIVLGAAGPGPATSQDVYRRIRDTAPGSPIALTTWRDKQRVDVRVEVGTRPRRE
jgi:serine protease Do